MMVPSKCPLLNPWNLRRCYFLWQEGICRCCLNSGSWEWEIILDYEGKPNVIRKVFIRGRSRLRVREIKGKKQRWELEICIWRQKMGSWAKECRQPLEIIEGITTHSSLEPLKETKPRGHILEFWPPELMIINLCCFKPLSLWYYIAAVTGN